MCADCGHIFVQSVPLSDESEGVANNTLAKALYYHMCSMQRKDVAPRNYRAHKSDAKARRYGQ